MNKIYIVHCWGGTKDDGWYPWLDEKITDNDNKIKSLAFLDSGFTCREYKYVACL